MKGLAYQLEASGGLLQKSLEGKQHGQSQGLGGASLCVVGRWMRITETGGWELVIEMQKKLSIMGKPSSQR